SVEVVVLRALEKEPDRRWRDMREMGDAIGRARMGLVAPSGAAPAVPSPQFRMSDPAVLRTRRRRQRLIVVGVAAATVGVAGVIHLGSSWAPGMVEVKLSPEDAILQVDGVAVDGRPPLSVPRGPHRITAVRPGYVSESRDLTLDP